MGGAETQPAKHRRKMTRKPKNATPAFPVCSGALEPSRSVVASDALRAPSSVYFGVVRHARYRPVPHRFRYRVFSLLIDLDGIENEAQKIAILSINRWNIFSFHYRDHGFEDHRSPRHYVDQLLQQHQLPAADRVFLMCYPRMFGYVFNPLAVYYVETNGCLTAMIYEVRNTFGERHVYFTKLSPSVPAHRHTHEKAFHVSPFIGMSAQYEFSTNLPDTEMRLVIRERVDGQPLLITSFIGHQKPLTATTLFMALFKYPLMTLKIIAGIHFEALRLWSKGVPLFKKPHQHEGN